LSIEGPIGLLPAGLFYCIIPVTSALRHVFKAANTLSVDFQSDWWFFSFFKGNSLLTEILKFDNLVGADRRLAANSNAATLKQMSPTHASLFFKKKINDSSRSWQHLM
jgi:hypothetical protein